MSTTHCSDARAYCARAVEVCVVSRVFDWNSFAFGALWYTGRVSRLCIQHIFNMLTPWLASSYWHSCTFCSRLGGRTLAPSVLAPCVCGESRHLVFAMV
ncbi:hypothetical protein SO802_015293 [Lithocarpus litseifolius]|uniref:Uncharacterized protein n=1 Tax=Lithocarpus litseifolius TaxID=425828 RepID=A0AAW2CTV7_9ROSI